MQCVQSLRGAEALWIFQSLPPYPDTRRNLDLRAFAFDANNVLRHSAHAFLPLADNQGTCVAGTDYFLPFFFLFIREKRLPEACSAPEHLDRHVHAVHVFPYLCFRHQNQRQIAGPFCC